MSLSEWACADAADGKITREALERTFEQIKNAPPDPCRLGKHVVSPQALKSGAKYARCANCYGVIQLR